MKFKMDFEGIKDIKVDKLEISSNQEEETSKSLNEQIKDFLNNDIFLKLIPLVLPILGVLYKYIIKYRFDLPMKYFKIDFTENLLNALILFIPAILSLITKKGMVQFLMLIILVPFEFFIVFKYEIILLICMYTNFGVLFLISILLDKNIQNKKAKYILIAIFIILFNIIYLYTTNFISKKTNYLIFSQSKCLHFLGIVIVEVFLGYFYKKENKSFNIKEKISLTTLYYMYIVTYTLFCLCILCLNFFKLQTDYEILKIDNEEKVVITTYEDKYLIADCSIYQDIPIIIINTENYEFIDINSEKIKNIRYEDFKHVYINEEGKKINELLSRDL